MKHIVTSLIEWCINEGFFPYGLMRSPSVSKKESLEFFVYLKIDKESKYYDYKNRVNNLL